MSDLAVRDYRDITATGEKLHDFSALARELRPARFGLRVLLQPAQWLALPFEIHLRESPLSGAPNGVGFIAEANGFRFFGERLAPHGEHGVIQS